MTTSQASKFPINDSNEKESSKSSSSSTTTSKDKKRRAQERTTTPLKQEEYKASNYDTDEEGQREYNCFDSVRPTKALSIGTNPFLATTLSERNQHFPSFDAAFLSDSDEHDSSNILSRQIGESINDINNGATQHPETSSVNLSISVLAALSEHNRHIARYGVDDSLIHNNEDIGDDENDDATFPSIFADPLDVEWERLLLNSSSNHSTYGNFSHVSLNQSVQSTSTPYQLQYPVRSAEQIQVVKSHSPDGYETEAIEVMTELSFSDFLNTSHPISILRTPEHVKIQQEQEQQQDGMIQSENAFGVTIRGRSMRREINDTSYDTATSHGSISDDSTRKLHNMYLNSLLPPSFIHHRYNNDSSSIPSTPSSPLRIQKSNDSNSPQNHHTTTSSFSLHNVDLSRISADDDDDDEDVNDMTSVNIIKNLDHSFNSNANENNNSNNSAIVLPTLVDRFDLGMHLLDHDQTPSTSNSKSRKKMHHKSFGSNELLSESSASPVQREYQHSRGSPKSSTYSPNNKNTISATNSYRAIGLSSTNHLPIDRSPNAYSNDGMMGLSPISRQAADRAISLLQSSPDWNTTPSRGGVSGSGSRPTMHSSDRNVHNPFHLEPLPDLIPGMNESLHPSRSYDSNTSTLNVIEYEHPSRSMSSSNRDSEDSDTNEIHVSKDNGDNISPLHSSSEPHNNTDTSNSFTKQNISESTETIADPIINDNSVINNSALQNSSCNSSSSDHLKKNSLSSISPNTSSEHHITTKPTATTANNSNSSKSSYSVTDNNSRRLELPTSHHDGILTTIRWPHEEPYDTAVLASSSTSPIGVSISKQQQLPSFSTDRTDRRRYRTVVPIRVFMHEPTHFPNEDDSFTIHHHYHTTTRRRKSSMLSTSTSSLPIMSDDRQQNHDRLERSVLSNPW